MKKIVSLLLVLTVVCTTLPLGVFAAETSTDNVERDALIAQACEVFPEYSSKIVTQGINTQVSPRSTSQRELVASLAREVSENETMVYSEYSDGIILLTDYTAQKEVTTVDRYSSSFAVNVTVDIKATCSNISGYFKLSNVKYSLINGAYDVINDVGTKTVSGRCSIHTAYTPVLNETASRPASLSYRLTFRYGSTGAQSINTLLTLTVQNDSATVTHEDNS